MFKKNAEIKICVVGLGYVGLPLAAEFGKKFATVGFDINSKRIERLKTGIDDTREVSIDELKEASKLSFTSSSEKIGDNNFYIITVPTPIDKSKRPNLQPILEASKTVGSVIKSGDIVVYESTVYPGVTEEECIPILEKVSGLKFNENFFVGYSPERINPGDKAHRLPFITKVVSGSTPEIADVLAGLYSEIIKAGVYKAENIKVAEAAKVIENTQRDINIALMNELAIIFDKMHIDTDAVLRAAATKWNFLNFRPGLVGGHCIGVDPYYLTHKAETLGYHPQLILAGRRLNDGMGAYAASRMVKKLLQQDLKLKNSKILVMGLTFKENCPDLRNSKVVDVINELKDFGLNVEVFDPWCSSVEANNEYGISLTENLKEATYDGIMICVAHDFFKQMTIKKIRSLCKETHVIFDLKHIFSADETDARL